MASQAAQVAGKGTRSMFARWGRRDPELIVLIPLTRCNVDLNRSSE